MDVSQRILRLLHSVAEDKFETIARWIEEGSGRLDERLRDWEAKFETDEETVFGDDTKKGRNSEQHEYSNEQAFRQTTADTQVRDDLQLFGLTPPSSLEAVRQVRNRELKKFHPDKYAGEPEKLETAKKIVQIYNTAYDRLKKHYTG